MACRQPAIDQDDGDGSRPSPEVRPDRNGSLRSNPAGEREAAAVTGRNWDKAAGRSRVARQGADPIGRPPKGARKEAADAEIVSKVLRCACGHRGRVELPSAMLAGKRFKCSRCGSRIG